MMVCVAILAILSASVYGLFATMYNAIADYRDKSIVSALADNYMEIARNLPYASIGTENGNPHGSLPDWASPAEETINGKLYQVYYSVTYIDDPADGLIVENADAYSNDYKQVKLYVKNAVDGSQSVFLTNISPKGTENAVSGGALYIKVFNAAGQPVSGAGIHIESVGITPAINLMRLSDVGGEWIEAGLPLGTNAYHITVSKDGYSTDQTRPASLQNPSPTKPDATVIVSQATQVGFAIDKLGSLQLSMQDSQCQPVSAGLALRGSKLIGNNPVIYKFDNTYPANESGIFDFYNIEWDTAYLPGLISDDYMVAGTSPVQSINLLPDSSANFYFVLKPKPENGNGLLVIVKDLATGNPIEGAVVNLSGNELGNEGVDKITGGSVWSQHDWSGGDGQADFGSFLRFYSQSGGLDVGGSVTIAKGNTSGSLISSTFDAGTNDVSYTSISWNPESQSAGAVLKFQLAGNNDNQTWNFTGPDGTENTYYTVSGTAISNTLDGKRYTRYKAFFSTSTGNKPILSSVNVNYVSGCPTPGQVFFSGMDGGDKYDISVSAEGYQSQSQNNITLSGYQILNISLSQ